MSFLKSLNSFFKHAFLPGKSNNQRPKILHPAGLSILVAIFLLNFSLRTLVTYLPGFVLGFSSSITVDEVVNLSNQERTKAGLSTLSTDPLLSQAAYNKALDMFGQNYWAHVSPTGTQPWTFIKNAGYSYRFAGENLARDFSDSTSVVNAWMGSPSHRENLLSDKYSNIGVAVVDGTLQGVETRLVVQMFGTPTPAPIAQVIPQAQAQQAQPQTQPQPQVQQPAPATAQITPVEEETPVPAETALEETPFIAQGQVRQEPRPQFVGSTAFQRLTSPLRDERIVSPTEITQVFGIMLVVLILGTLVVDWVIAHRRRTVRLVGRNWAHITYMVVVGLMLLQYAQGRIL